uniref:Lipase_3 domain-containing protein n=1 Tax=Steinernema glaseri TaxID=37863 RepID=A0A1I7ZE77_9BILA
MNSVYSNGGNNSIHRVVEVACDQFQTDNCKALTAISHSDKAIIISFRGTEMFLQIVQEALDTLIKHEKFEAGGYVSSYFYEAFKAVWNGGLKDDFLTLRNQNPEYEKFEAGGYVSSYFYEAFKAVWNGGLKDDFLTLRNQNPDYEVWVTGHSLGGAMASLCAATLAHNGLVNTQNLKLMTFGQPRVGDKVYAAVHDALVLYSYRVVHNRDMIAQIPPKILPDHGLFDGFQHNKAEVFYENAMRVGDSYTVCDDSDESNQCSDGLLITLSIPDHFRYFEAVETILDYGEDGCPRNVVSS